MPAAAIERIDIDDRKVRVALTKDQIKNCPELDEDADYRSEDYRTGLGGYYDPCL